MRSKMTKKLIAFLLCMVLVICNSVSILADTPAPEAVSTQQVKETKAAPEVETTTKKEETTEATTEKKEKPTEAAEETTTETKEGNTKATTEVTEETTTETKEDKTEATTEVAEETTTETKEETTTAEESSETSATSEETTEADKAEETTTKAKEETAAVTELKYENEEVVITVSQVAEGAIPEGAELKVVPILKNDTETQAQYAEVEKQIQEKAAETETEIKGFLAYDISFVDKDGNEVEPNSEVKVSMEYRQAAIPGDITAEDAKNAEVSVMHLEEDADGNVAEVVDMGKAGKIDTLETTDDNKVEKVEVKTESFSNFVAVWSVKNLSLTTSGQTSRSVENQIVSFENLANKFTPSPGSVTNDWQILEEKYTSPIVYDYKNNGEVRIAKKIIPTEKENEFYIYLDIEPRMEWSTETLFSRADIWIVNSANLTTGLSDKSLPTTAQGIKDNANSLDLGGIGQVAKLCTSIEDAMEYPDNTTQGNIKQSELKTPTTIKISGTNEVVLSGNYYYGIKQESFDSFTLLVSIPGTGKFFKMGGVSYDENTHVMTIPKEAYQELEEDIENIGDYGSMVQTAIPTSVEDTMGACIDFVEFESCNNGVYTPFNEESKSFQWKELTKLESDNDASHYEIINPGEDNESIYRKFAYQLVYKIRLDVTDDNFESCAEELFNDPVNTNNNVHYPTNSSTKLNYHFEDSEGVTDNKAVEFISPVVRGLLYDVEFLKQDSNGRPLSGAVFEITRNADEEKYFESTKTQQTATSKTDGSVKFKGLPWGTYTLRETKAPEGYQIGENTTKNNIQLCYTAHQRDLGQNHDTSHLADTFGDIKRALYNKNLIGTNGVIINIKNTTSVNVEKNWVIADKTYTNDEMSIEIELVATVNGKKYELPETVKTQQILRGKIANGSPVDLEDWKYTFTNLPLEDTDGNPIDYSVVETKILGYLVEDQSYFACEVQGTGNNHFTITNTAINYWQINKVSSTDNSIGLEGALFTLTEESGITYYGKSYDDSVDPTESGKIYWFKEKEDIGNGDKVLKYIPDGTYTLKETTAPAGYQKSTITWTIVIEDLQLKSIIDSKGVSIYPQRTRAATVSIKFENIPLYALPESGGPGIYWYTLSGALLMMGAALIVYKQQRKREVLLKK